MDPLGTGCEQEGEEDEEGGGGPCILPTFCPSSPRPSHTEETL